MTETRTFVGQTSTQILDGYAGFRVGQSWQPRYTILESSDVSIEIDYARKGVGSLLIKWDLY